MQLENFLKLLKNVNIESGYYSDIPDLQYFPFTGDEDEDVTEKLPVDNYIPDEVVFGCLWNEISIPGLDCRLDTNYKHPVGHPSQLFDYETDTTFTLESLEFTVENEDGEELDEYEIEELIMKHTKIGVFDWSILGTDEDNIDFIGPDVVPPEGYARIELECTDSGDQHFIGKEIASSSDEALGDHRWFEYTVYQLLDGSYACYHIHDSVWSSEPTKRSVKYYKSLADVKNQLIESDAAECVCEELGI